MTLLAGWGRTAPTRAEIVRPDDADALARAGRDAGPRGVIARGLGRSYGDAAQNAGGLVVDATGVSGVLELDAVAGVVRALGGTSLEDVLRAAVPAGWFVPVSPGTRHVTVGGAIASDIHGKNHHADGTFGAHVRSIVLATADGSTRVLTPQDTPDELWATCGGMGLTGTVVEATFAMRRIGSSRLLVDTERVPHLDELLARLRDGQARHRYSVAWIDLLARGRALGRAVLTQGEFEPSGPLEYDPRPPLPAPPAPSGLLNRLSIRAFNELWFRRAPARRHAEPQSISTFFHPLDMLGNWNRLYGPAGFVQWQCVVPFGAEDTLRDVVESLSGHGTASFLAVLKTFGAANPGPLSFPAPGWTLALDVPAGAPGLAPLLDGLDRAVVDAGGRIYLAKDGRVRPELVPTMYPRLDEWRAVRDRLDPERRLRSDLARRLRLS